MAVRELQLVTIGEVPAAFLRELEAPIAQVLGVSAYVGKAALPAPVTQCTWPANRPGRSTLS